LIQEEVEEEENVLKKSRNHEEREEMKISSWHADNKSCLHPSM
jgi:hypothetical protein